MDAIALVSAIYEVIKFMNECRQSAAKNDRSAADILGRLLVFEFHFVTLHNNARAGKFQDQSKMQALLRLCEAVQGAEKWVRKHLRAKNGGLVVWAKGRWHAKEHMEELEDIAMRIDRAVHDLTFSELQIQGRERATAQAGIEGFQEEVRGELGGLGRKVDALLQRATSASAAGGNGQLDQATKQEIAELCQTNIAEVNPEP
jgi:hypothetical protein